MRSGEAITQAFGLGVRVGFWMRRLSMLRTCLARLREGLGNMPENRISGRAVHAKVGSMGGGFRTDNTTAGSAISYRPARLVVKP